MNLKKCELMRNAEMDAIAPMFNGGFLRIYDGAQPKTPETQNNSILLAELRFATPAYLMARDGLLVANAIADEKEARHSGLARWFRCFRADGISALMDGDAGKINADLIMQQPIIGVGDRVKIGSFILDNQISSSK